MKTLSLWLAVSFVLCALHTRSEANDLKFIEPPGAYRYSASLPDEGPGFRLAPKSYVEDLDPAAEPGPVGKGIRLEVTPGEHEPATFVIYATRDLPQVQIQVGDLHSEAGAPIPASAIEVRRVVRSPQRLTHDSKPDTAEIMNRFLARWKPMDVPTGEFREIWLTLHVPEEADAGEYAGEVKVQSAGLAGTLGLYVRVLPFKLAEPKDKGLGLYYAARHVMEQSPKWLRRDLADMRAHGVRNLKTTLRIAYRREADGTVVPDTSRYLQPALTILAEMGFKSIVISDNFISGLTSITGHGNYAALKSRGEPGLSAIEKDPAFRAAVRRTLNAFKALERKFPTLDLYLSHLDEVFKGEWKQELYSLLVRIAREESPEAARFYITFHTQKERHTELRKRIDPYVDLRNNHGYTFEWWLSRGHTMDEYRRELAASGDKAWFYHNFTWRCWTPEWSRIINGIFLWVSPFEVHCPDCCQFIPGLHSGNPYDETIGRSAWYCMFLPDPEDPDLLVPTRLWECMREGFDDVRYFVTLESLIEEKSDEKPAEAAKAKEFLSRLRSLVENAKFERRAARLAVPTPAAEIDLETQLVCPRPRGDDIGGRSPLIGALAARFSGAGWNAIRHKAVEYIVALQE